MNMWIIHTRSGEVCLIGGIVPDRSEVGSDIGSVCGDCHRTAEGYLLPAGTSLVCKTRTGKKGPGRRPKSSNVSSGIGTCLVKPNTANETIGIGPELNSQSEGVGVAA